MVRYLGPLNKCEFKVSLDVESAGLGEALVPPKLITDELDVPVQRGSSRFSFREACHLLQSGELLFFLRRERRRS